MSIAAVILIKERRLVERLRSAQATTPEAAVPLGPLHGADGLAVGRLRRRDVIRESSAGSFYLDEPTWTALRRRRRLTVAVVVSVALIAVLASSFLLRP